VPTSNASRTGGGLGTIREPAQARTKELKEKNGNRRHGASYNPLQ